MGYTGQKTRPKRSETAGRAVWLLRRVPTTVVIPVQPAVSAQSRNQLLPVNWDPTFNHVRNYSP